LVGKPREELVARFGVGTTEGPRSAVWRLWVGKGTSDVYIAARAHGGDYKVSLHESGVWRFAFTDVYRRRRSSSGAEDRVIERWNRPPPIEGITPAFMIVVPSGEVGLPRHPLTTEKAKKYTKGVTWVPPAPEGFATYFMVMYAPPDGPTPSEDIRFVSRFELPSREIVSIMVDEQEISGGQAQQLEAERQRIAEAVRQGPEAERAALETWLEPRAWFYGHNEFGTRFFVDISGDYLFEE
jgi:hypothetical protein